MEVRQAGLCLEAGRQAGFCFVGGQAGRQAFVLLEVRQAFVGGRPLLEVRQAGLCWRQAFVGGQTGRGFLFCVLKLA